MVLVGVSILALQQHGPVQFTECLLKMPRFPTAPASQAILAQGSASNATATAFQNEQGDELKLDDLIGSFGVEANIYRISINRGEGNEQGNMEIERKSDAMLNPDSNSQLQEEILLIDTNDSFSTTRIFSANRNSMNLLALRNYQDI